MVPRKVGVVLAVQVFVGLTLAVACGGTATPVQEVNAPPDSIVTSTRIDPFHPADPGTLAPEVVVEINLENRYYFNLIPTAVNGLSVQFNADPQYNNQQPLSIPPGKVRFVLTNTGTITHNFRIIGTTPDGRTLDFVTPGLDKFIPPGGMWEMEVKLAEGRYRMLCNVTNHEMRGMTRDLIVTKEAVYPPPPVH